jgi:hypothetical protein
MCDPSRPPGPALARPRWGLLYGAAFSPLAALAVVEAAAPPNGVRTLLRGVCALLAFVGMAVWVRASRKALDMLDWCACAGETVTVRVIESRRPRRLAELPEPAPLPEPTPLTVPADEERELIRR